jgi:DedD protein
MRERESMAGSPDTEITLGVGKLLGLFLTLVVLCALSMGTGYWMGRSSAKLATSVVPPSVPAAALSGARKPGAAEPAGSKDCGLAGNCAPRAAATSNPSSSDLTFYQSVRQNESHPQLAPQTSETRAPAAVPEARSTLGNGYLVQIAAVRNQDDAKLLSETLRKQQYPVVISQPGDNLFHVQVGPYAELKQAEAIRSRLITAGYNPFLKR